MEGVGSHGHDWRAGAEDAPEGRVELRLVEEQVVVARARELVVAEFQHRLGSPGEFGEGWAFVFDCDADCGDVARDDGHVLGELLKPQRHLVVFLDFVVEGHQKPEYGGNDQEHKKSEDIAPRGGAQVLLEFAVIFLVIHHMRCIGSLCRLSPWPGRGDSGWWGCRQAFVLLASCSWASDAEG